jgi:hypothetical protein
MPEANSLVCRAACNVVAAPAQLQGNRRSSCGPCALSEEGGFLQGAPPLERWGQKDTPPAVVPSASWFHASPHKQPEKEASADENAAAWSLPLWGC